MQSLIAGAAKLGLDLDERQRLQFQTYYSSLVEWNRRAGLTTITGYQDVLLKHFLDSLTAVLALRRDSSSPQLAIIDVGAGGGFPGVPLKIVLPEIGMVLLESTGKKTAFLVELVRRLGLQGVRVINARAEDLARDPGFRERFDVVLARAVAGLNTLSELTLPFCKIGGVVIAHKACAVDEELRAALPAVSVLGGRVLDIITVKLEELSNPNRCLVVIEKVTPTPTKYPRRAGIPQKRPIT